MRKVILYTTVMFLFTGCGGSEETEGEKETVTPAAETKVIHSIDTIISKDIDSALLGKMAEIADKRTDSLYLELDSLSNSNDSLLAMIDFMKSSLDKNLPVKFPKPDSTDYNIPPNGSAQDPSYKTFESIIPSNGKELKELPKGILGTYAKPDNAQVVISKEKIMYTNTNGKTETMFDIDSDKICSLGDDSYLLQYKTDDKWRVVVLTLKHGNLSYRIIPKDTSLTEKSNKKEVKKYLEGNSQVLLQVYTKVK